MENVHLTSLSIVFFVLVVLLTKQKKEVSDWILIAIFAILLANSWSYYLLATGSTDWNWLIELCDLTPLLVGPCLLIYIHSLFENPLTLTLHRLLHFLPFLLVAVYMTVLFLNDKLLDPRIRSVISSIELLSVLVYLIFLWIIINRYRIHLLDYFSNQDSIKLRWLRFMLIGGFVVWAIGVAGYLIPVIFNDLKPNALSTQVVSNVSISMLSILLGFYGFRQTNLFVSFVRIEKDTGSSSRQVTDEEKQHLEHVSTRLEAFMQKKQPYLDPNLTLGRLADQSRIPTEQLSRTINTIYGQHFFDFINNYRVEAVKQKINEGELYNHTLLEIAFESGFNSKATFNRAFKKHTGLTPTQYKTKSWKIK